MALHEKFAIGVLTLHPAQQSTVPNHLGLARVVVCLFVGLSILVSNRQQLPIAGGYTCACRGRPLISCGRGSWHSQSRWRFTTMVSQVVVSKVDFLESRLLIMSPKQHK
jgi:phosphatidylglycerophosphate synthase